jgi:ubiquinone/menaquinone biosynthesis C-methylase UbiE/DNA-binding transcriptional ArsR family regulator
MATTVFDTLNALADSTRSRLLLTLERHELTVSELCAITQLPQSTVSRHLRILSDEAWVTSRAEGTTRQYRMSTPLDPAARRLWQVVREQLTSGPQAVQDVERTRSVLARRRIASREFFSTAAGQWDGLRRELFGQRTDLAALPALLDPAWTIGDLGCGTGQLAGSLAPFVKRVIGVDASRPMLAAARRRLADCDNVELRAGELEALPLADGELDAATLFLVLHYVVEPIRALTDVTRALKPGGRLLVVDMMPHDREEYRQKMGHLWQGFSADQLGQWSRDAGLDAMRYIHLPPDPEAKGPALFAASLCKHS